MERKSLIPRNVIEILGKLSYGESLGAWNTIRFKKELVKEFPQLEEKRSKFSYKVVYYKDLKGFEKTLKEVKREGNLPLLLWVFKEEN